MSLRTKLRRAKISSFEPMRVISWILLVLAQKKKMDHTVTLCTSAHVTRNILRNSVMCWSCADLSGMHWHLGQWWHLDPAIAEDHICVHDPIAAGVCAEFQVQYCYQRLFRTPRLGATTWGFGGVWKPCHLPSYPNLGGSASTQSQDVIRGHGQTATEGHDWVHGPAAAGICVDVCGVACVTSRSHRNHAWWNQRSILSQP